MVVSDPIADMLTRIRNANQLRYKEVEIPTSKMKKEIARILKEEGYISGYKMKEEKTGDLIVLDLKYGDKKERVITGLKRISKVFSVTIDELLSNDELLTIAEEDSKQKENQIRQGIRQGTVLCLCVRQGTVLCLWIKN